MLICKEILATMPEGHEDRTAYSTFHMTVYAFPNPADTKQLEMIRALGFVDNVAQDIKIETPDYVTLANVRREALKNIAHSPKITSKLSSFSFFSFSLVSNVVRVP